MIQKTIDKIIKIKQFFESNPDTWYSARELKIDVNKGYYQIESMRGYLKLLYLLGILERRGYTGTLNKYKFKDGNSNNR
jgi:hypothetical protein